MWDLPFEDKSRPLVACAAISALALECALAQRLESLFLETARPTARRLGIVSGSPDAPGAFGEPETISRRRAVGLAVSKKRLSSRCARAHSSAGAEIAAHATSGRDLSSKGRAHMGPLFLRSPERAAIAQRLSAHAH